MSVVQPEVGLLVGGKYRLLERIGSGGMSEVYRAENTSIRRVVAVKLLRPAQADDRQLHQRLLAEAQTVSSIRHPAIVDMLDAGVGDIGPFIVMEYLVGKSAARALALRTRLSLNAALATVLPMLDGLAVAHQAGVIHRDLKPENVFYSMSKPEGLRVKLLDFGIAKVLLSGDDSPQTATGIVFGTPDYMSPEQAAGDFVLDARSDLFSLGIVLFELLTGERPFRGPSAVATAYKIAHAKTPRLAELGGPDNVMLDAIIARALQKRADERYASADEFVAELKTLNADLDAGREELATLVGASSEADPTSASPERARATSEKLRRPAASPLSGRAESSPAVTPRFDLNPLRREAFETTEQRPAVRATGRAASGASESSVPIRSRPAAPAGQWRVRGVVLRAVDEHVRATLGDARRADLLAELPHEHSRDFEYGTLQGIVHYDLAALTAYMAAATGAMYGGNESRWRGAGGAAVDGELAPLLKNALRSDLPYPLLKRVASLCERFFDFGKWELLQDGDRLVTVRIRDFEPASLALRLWLAGVLESSVGRAAPPARLVVARGEVAFAPQLGLDVSW